MPVYEYRGITTGNRSTRGLIDAENVRAAGTKLRADGIYPTHIHEGRTRTPVSETLGRLRIPWLSRVPDLHLSLFSSQLATLLAAGVPLVESLSALTEQVEHERLKKIVARVRESVNRGTTLADSLAEFPHVFDDLYCAMVRAGESAGALDLVLQRLAAYLESRMELRNKMTNAMIYPALMLVVSAVVSGVLLVKVIPQITQLLRDLNQPLPLATVVVIAVSEFLRGWWVVLSLSAAGALLAGNRLIHTAAGRLWWDRLRLRLPVIGRLNRYVAISRFARTLSTLLTGGVNIVQALAISAGVAGNSVIARAVGEARDAITRGTSVAAPLRQSGQFPALVTHMVAVGEASGELDSMLAKVADTYDRLVDNSLGRLMALMGPILLVVVAGIVTMIILSTLLPLINLTSAL